MAEYMCVVHAVRVFYANLTYYHMPSDCCGKCWLVVMAVGGGGGGE